ncbi:protein dj-1beta-like [Atheta coriaria]|uniref:protein dj-1beta-like n=1 Tax=Dalotia coriaria TaxID=877792 RepID=UPI0031F438A3
MSCLTILHVLRRPAATSFFHSQKHANFRNFPRFAHCNMATKKRALVFLAPGFEEIEFITAVDVLRRGGVEVVVASTDGGDHVCGSNNVRIMPDQKLCDIKESFDALVLPGGLGGATAMAKSAQVGEMLREQEKKCKIIAAICAAPTVLKAHGVGKGKNVTSYPAMEKEMSECGDYKYKNDDVVVDEYLITSRGPGTSFKFAFTVLKQLTDDVKASEIAKRMLCM